MSQTVVYYEGCKWIEVLDNPNVFPKFVRQRITSEWAKDVLLHRNNHNRKFKKHRINKFVRDIKTDRWMVTNQGIGFDKRGNLLDGQNRLQAIAISGIAVEMLVTYGMANNAQPVIDDVAIRSDFDISTLAQLGLTRPQITLMNYILEVKNLQNATKPERLVFYEEHKDAAKYATDRIKKKYVAKSPVLAVIARAFYSVDRSRLDEFCNVLETGQKSGPGDHAAFLLREYANEYANHNTGPARKTLYRKTQMALQKFIEKYPSEKLNEANPKFDNTSFPLPEEVIHDQSHV